MIGVARALAVVVGLIALGAQLACVPFYAGGPLGARTRWRLEHGRMTVARSVERHRVTFFVDINHERMRWWPELRWEAAGEWMVAAPLWLVWGPLLGAAWGPGVVRAVRRGRGSRRGSGGSRRDA